jgi:hypothetical protein
MQTIDPTHCPSGHCTVSDTNTTRDALTLTLLHTFSDLLLLQTFLHPYVPHPFSQHGLPSSILTIALTNHGNHPKVVQQQLLP